ncbi:MAG TPA: phosphate ABC transporter permease subunit PstC [Chthoniobacteraceae bacterium]|nr:phosphate ABC transporter permease subunit PstC [Chthoniobacteraceae bacterium]
MISQNRFDRRRRRYDRVIQRFLGANATVAIVVLVLIALFLFKEGAGFFPQNLENLRTYRLAGLEYVDLMRGQVDRHTVLNRSLQAIRTDELTALLDKGVALADANAQLAEFDAFSTRFSRGIAPVRAISSDLTDLVSGVKEKVIQRENEIARERFLRAEGKNDEANAVVIPEIDFAAEVRPARETFPLYQQAAIVFRREMGQLLETVPPVPGEKGRHRLETFREGARAYLASFPEVEHRLETWDQFEPVPWYRSITSFLFGKAWITNSFWQDVYGVLPLVTGSLLIAVMALVIAVPLGIGAAIYISEIATLREQRLIKPLIEFISAIPSVVLGFFGIIVLGSALRAATHWPVFSWIDGFPISERLNAFTAAALLALMAVPTIFSLAEDALNSVPRHFKEASYALGANRLQTIVRVLLPTALSGIISAVLLGFGRVIGETMVVLLCAGNRIAIPDFTKGISTFFEPVHTMTGIVAQEMGEVVHGSIQYRALFMVGLLLFALALVINWLAQAAVRRFRDNIS